MGRECATRGSPRSLNEPGMETDASLAESWSKDVSDECLLCLALADDDHLDQRLGLPPTTFIFQSSPRA